MAAAPAEVIRPLRREEYDQLVALGAFQDERVELLDGALYAMSPIGIPHDFAVQELNELLVLALPGRAKVRPQMSFAASELSEPEPDLMVTPLVRWDTEQANQAHLIIEVAESSLAHDRGRKLRLYASSACPNTGSSTCQSAASKCTRSPRAARMPASRSTNRANRSASAPSAVSKCASPTY